MRPPLTLALLATPQAVAGVRSALRAYMGGPCADLQLCASELLANVVRHLGEGVLVTVQVGCEQGRTRLEVTDPDPHALPVLCEATADDESGRGLALLDALTLRWGVEQGPGSKTVWCELATWQSEGRRGRHPGQSGGRQGRGGRQGEAVGRVPVGVRAVVDPDPVPCRGPGRGAGCTLAVEERGGERFGVLDTDNGS
ncbi:ATP-binding protein [Streptomyces xantholiticus]|uniref:ATP-binding protein n=1 Tax=Streptomyces xantholiticus TaxID=68285 RepID=UPI0019A3DEB2|nr:ATP-binding protein [Streptomyces xantholiticus]GGW42986.1 hypothetical protein GCM10010381_29890 [Streptomyces xantholiticus]